MRLLVTGGAGINPGDSGKRAPFAKSTADEFNRSIDGSAKIAISGPAPKGATLLNRFLSIERLEELSIYEKSFIISNFYQDFQNSKTSGTDSYSVFNKDDSTFITLSTSKGYVKNASEWAQFYVATTGSAKNLVITSSKSPDDLPPQECNRIKSMLDAAVKNGKNVFYVYSGDKASVNVENNIRYISLGDVSQYNVQNMDENKKYCSYIVFYVKGSDIGYEFIS